MNKKSLFHSNKKQLVYFLIKRPMIIAFIVLFFTSNGCVYNAKGRDSAINKLPTKGVEFTGYIESRSFGGGMRKYVVTVTKVLNAKI